MVHGKPRHSQSQGSVERANRDVQDKLACWLRDNKPKTWSKALPFVQFQKNSSYHSGIGRPPYEAMFGNPPMCGLKRLNIPEELLQELESEEQLEALLTTREPEQQPDEQQAEEPVQLPTVTPSVEETPNLCQVCDLEVSIDESCSNCSKAVHFDERCSISEAHGSRSAARRICTLCHNQRKITESRKKAGKAQAKQANKMTLRTANIMQEANVGDTVTIPVPDLDRGRGDHRNIFGIILTKEDTFCKLGTEFGTLASLFSRNQFSLSKEKFLNASSVPDTEISVREAARMASSGSGQGFFKCNCATKCQSSKCKYKKASVLCNSKCHGSNSCCKK